MERGSGWPPFDNPVKRGKINGDLNQVKQPERAEQVAGR